MNILKSVLLIIIAAFLAACTKNMTEDDYIEKTKLFHANYNSGKHYINIRILQKNTGMDASESDYQETFEFVKSRLGAMRSTTLLNANFTQTTSSGEKLVRLSLDSHFELGVAKEFFYFSESGTLYRHEIYSEKLLNRDT
ncbi:type IV pilus biogenesis protein CpaD/CtpE [Comamonas sp. BIGb0152]|uniref:hypothetical protein n=1 Tax=Comamonas sp. BIGb0152 TaxID=2940601 RepID=UPI002168CBD4|nr:hypothetical protein [Comamonas sp. BIGb0152]MCS4292954.1 type IV pilus biogenesis protein CpaD/CtpE [Comamonas sp. BIGb0152]